MNERKPVVLVTGASGFVGRHVVPALAREGWSIRRAVRKPEGMDDEVVIETIGPETDWQAALQGVDAVVHLAARVHHKHEEHAVQLYRNVNIAGTLHLARSAATAGVRQFIFISTVLVHGRSNEGRGPFSEDDVLTPRGLYGMSKAAAEAGLKTLARDSAMKVSVIRPPLVYGAGAKGNFALLTRAVNLGLPLPFAAIRNHLPCRAEPVVVHPAPALSSRSREQFRDLPGGRQGAGLDARVHRAAGQGCRQELAAVRHAAGPARDVAERVGPAGYA
jgi:UDP-glucose 4-epimerase